MGLYSQGSMRFTYGNSDWLDLLTGVSVTDKDGNITSGTITYDASGNPLSYFNGANYTMTWRNGKELNTLTTGGKQTSYEYDVDGLRTRKTNSDGSYSDYYWLGTLLLVEQRYDKNGNRTYTLRFSYDENDSPIGIAIKSGSASTFNYYYYAKNVQGDVIGLYQWTTSSTGAHTAAKVATYAYDPWGNFLGAYNASGSKITAAANAALLNPIRYRGYYYDSESGFYYLQARYYDPQISRFINADDYAYTDNGYLSYNMFTYCLNNPINMTDEAGTWPNWVKKAVAAVAVVAVVAVAAAVTVATAGAGTAAAVVAVGAAKGAAVGMVSGAAIGAATSAVKHRVKTGSWKGAGAAALEGMADGALSGAVTGAISGAASSAVKVARAAKCWDKGTFKSGYQSMKYHYDKHVLKEGLSKGNSVVKYTKDAINFSRRNTSVLKYTYNYKYGNASWNLTYSSGQGGMFTSVGKIITSWYK